MRQIYLDHNATTVMEQGAKRALLFYSSTSQDPQPNFGNASSVNWAGRRVKSVVDDAREQIALSLKLKNPEEICFTGSATESINMALKGFFFQRLKAGKRTRIITSAVEHEAVIQTAHFLAELGAELHFLSVNSQGELDRSELESLLRTGDLENTLVSIMAANNETGVIFPWEDAARLAKKYGASFHLDAVQALGKIPGFSLAEAPWDFVSISAHKIGGAKGVGALVVRRGATIESLLHGGAQERKRRAGTTNVAGIAAFGAAAEALSERDLVATASLREQLEARVLAEIEGATVQGARAKRIVNTANFLFSGVRGEALLMGLDLEGFAVSAGSACNSGSILPSHVLLAMGLDKAAAQSAIRVSLGPLNTEEEILLFVESLKLVVARIRAQTKRSVATT